MRPALLGSAVASVLLAGSASAATLLPGAAPDWNQPYQYGPPVTAGPGPDPSAGFDPFDAWCAPTSGSNLLGYHEDNQGLPVADGVVFPGTPLFGLAPWHDYELDGGRPPPATPPPAAATDLGWYMDTNNTGDGTFGNGFHVGTYTKDIHAGLQTLLDTVQPGWHTGTRGSPAPGGAGAFGLASSGAAATPHATAASAFAEVVAEIDKGRPVLVQWSHWNVVASGILLMGDPSFEFFTFGANPGGDAVWGTSENWEVPEDPGLTLGHVVTAVGYIRAGDVDDPGRDQTGTIVGIPVGDPNRLDTDWVIVHDNVPGTPTNVIVPLTALEFPAPWTANTNAIYDTDVDGVPDPGDNCPFASNPLQQTSAQPGLVGVGCACLCGDVNNSCTVSAVDALEIQVSILPNLGIPPCAGGNAGLCGTPPIIELRGCDANASSTCSAVDALTIQLTLPVLVPGVLFPTASGYAPTNCAQTDPNPIQPF